MCRPSPGRPPLPPRWFRPASRHPARAHPARTLPKHGCPPQPSRREHHPVPAGKSPRTTPYGTVIAPPAARIAIGSSRDTGDKWRQRPAPARQAPGRGQAPRQHRPPRCREPSHTSSQCILPRPDDDPPPPSSATTRGLPVSSPLSQDASGRRPNSGATGGGGETRDQPTPARSSRPRRSCGTLDATSGSHTPPGPHNSRSRAVQTAVPVQRIGTQIGGDARRLASAPPALRDGRRVSVIAAAGDVFSRPVPAGAAGAAGRQPVRALPRGRGARAVVVAVAGGPASPAGVPNTADRVAQTAAAMQLEARLEPVFHRDSYGCHRRPLGAIAGLNAYAVPRPPWRLTPSAWPTS